MTDIDQRLMIVVSAIKQSIQMGTSPGLSVNTHPNPFFLHVSGEIDLKAMAERVLERVGAYDERASLQRAKEMAAAGEPLIGSTG
jgi:hypothetical protein